MNKPIILAEIAERVMMEKGFVPEFPASVQEELLAIKEPALPHTALHSFRDLRDRLWVSIDNDDSRDLDQLTFAETADSGNDTFYVAVADVDALVKQGSAIDKHAACNTTSVYTPTKTFPMLPEQLSTNLTSLNEKVDRCAIVVEITVDKAGGFDLSNIYPAWVHNYAKLTYKGVGAWLEQGIALPARFATLSNLEAQLTLQDQITQRIQTYRDCQGALAFEKIETELVIVDGLVVGLEERSYNRAQSLIENAMIAANAAATRYLSRLNLPTLRRIVRVPKRWDRIIELAKQLGYQLPTDSDAKALRIFLQKEQQRDPTHFPELSLAIIKLIGRGEYVLGRPEDPPLGHFDLALRDYAHTTAPNRRYPDLIMQRLLKSHLYGQTVAYTNEELAALAAHCTQKEDDANKVERRLQKSAAAMVLSTRIGKNFKAMVTGATNKGTWVRIFQPPIEGKLVQSFHGLDVGDALTVKLVHTDIANGYIDFVQTA